MQNPQCQDFTRWACPINMSELTHFNGDGFNLKLCLTTNFTPGLSAAEKLRHNLLKLLKNLDFYHQRCGAVYNG